MKITKEAIHTDTEALASKMAGLTDAVADSPSEWKDNVKKSFDDMMLTGTGVMDSGKHVATSDIYLPPEQSKSTEPAFTTESAKADNALGKTLSVYGTEPQEQEWDGEGLPPVGVECYLFIGGEKHHVEIEGYSRCRNIVFVKCHGLHEFDYWFLHDDCEFRSIQPTAERNHAELASLIESFSNLSAGIQANHILDWIENDMLKDGE